MMSSSLPASACLRVDRSPQGVWTLTMSRPEAFNALSAELITAMQQAVEAIGRDEQSRAVVLAGSGRAFCAGHDLKEMRASPSIGYYNQLFGQCGQMMMALQKLPVPVIARVHGMATAAGCQLVAMCDLAVAAEEARFAVSGVRLGLFCSTPSVALSRNLSRKAAFEMLVTGDFISATEAMAKGLVNRVVPLADLDAEVGQMLDSILAKPREALAIGKALFYRQLETGIESAYDDASHTMACNMMEPTALEGVQAFIDKRSPTWAVGPA